MTATIPPIAARAEPTPDDVRAFISTELRRRRASLLPGPRTLRDLARLLGMHEVTLGRQLSGSRTLAPAVAAAALRALAA